MGTDNDGFVAFARDGGDDAGLAPGVLECFDGSSFLDRSGFGQGVVDSAE